MGRIAALLLPYYEKDTPQGVRNMEAEDWAAELGIYPQWSVERAVRWWKSEANPERRKRPLEGDIAARCKRETDAVRATTRALRRPSSKPIPQQEEPRDTMTVEQRAEADAIVKAAGFALRNNQNTSNDKE